MVFEDFIDFQDSIVSCVGGWSRWGEWALGQGGLSIYPWHCFSSQFQEAPHSCAWWTCHLSMQWDSTDGWDTSPCSFSCSTQSPSLCTSTTPVVAAQNRYVWLPFAALLPINGILNLWWILALFSFCTTSFWNLATWSIKFHVLYSHQIACRTVKCQLHISHLNVNSMTRGNGVTLFQGYEPHVRKRCFQGAMI